MDFVIVIEVKYDQQEDECMVFILQYLFFWLSKNFKFVIGINFCYG